MMRTLLALIAAGTPLMVGCVDDASLGSSSQAVTGSNKLSTNKLSTNKLSTNKLSTNKLSTNKLSTNKLSTNKLSTNMLTASDLLSSADGREVYSYIISCAVPEGITLEATVDGVTYEFPGGIGLAPDWLHRTPTRSEKRWVSACMFARCNRENLSEEISLRGNDAALAVTADEANQFVLEEGAFFGDLFTPDDESIDWNACRGEDQAAGEFGGLEHRDCTEPDPNDPTKTLCGFNYAGDCADYTPQYPSPYACGDYTSGYYGDCHATSGIGNWPESPKYREVITTYVTDVAD